MLCGTFPSSPRRGGCAINKCREATFARRRARSASPIGRSSNSGEEIPTKLFCNSSPPRPLHQGGFASFLLLSRPPLLGEEGNVSRCPRLQLRSPDATWL